MNVVCDLSCVLGFIGTAWTYIPVVTKCAYTFSVLWHRINVGISTTSHIMYIFGGLFMWVYWDGWMELRLLR